MRLVIELGATGTKAIELLFNKAVETGLIKQPDLPLIID